METTDITLDASTGEIFWTDGNGSDILLFDSSSKSVWVETGENEITIDMQELHDHIHNKEAHMNLYSWEAILFIMIVCIVTVKFVIPRLTLRNIVRSIKNRIWKPIDELKYEARKEWHRE